MTWLRWAIPTLLVGTLIAWAGLALLTNEMPDQPGSPRSTGIEGSIAPGQIYAAHDEESGGCHVLKVLSANDSTVVVRRYANVFDDCPTDVPDDLRLGFTLEDLQRGDLEIGWGAIAIDATGFAADAQQYTYLGERPVTDEERENVEEASL
jgi:hypothetical protein